MRTWPLLPLVSLALLATACEVIAPFDPDKVDQERTVGPTPLPTLDGAVPVVPDAAVRSDAAIVKPLEPDAGPAHTRDAGGMAADAGAELDGGPSDAARPSVDAAADANDGRDADVRDGASAAELDAAAGL